MRNSRRCEVDLFMVGKSKIVASCEVGNVCMGWSNIRVSYYDSANRRMSHLFLEELALIMHKSGNEV